MASEDDEVSWILDGIVNLLRGPVWSVPILTFVEHKSVTFEAMKIEEEEEGNDEEEEEEDEEEDHKKVHQEYKELVDFLLNSFMEDLQVSAEQLEKACERAAISTPFHRSLFQQVWAADDYPAFRSMMVQKNIELQLQALQMLQFKYGIDMGGGAPTELVAEDEDLAKREREILEEVYRLSREEHEATASILDQDQHDLELALARSTQDEKDRLERSLRRHKKKREEEEEEEGEEQEEEEEEEAEEEKFSKIPVLPPIGSKGAAVDEEDLRRRQEYLRGQRDKLLALKQKEREKQLEAYEQIEVKRPQSSRAARQALVGEQVNSRTLAARRALAERLKAEVIKD